MSKDKHTTTFETRSWTAASSVTNSIGDRASRSSRASKTHLVPDEEVPALPYDAWKRRSVKRSSYDYKHISAGLSRDEAAVLAHDAKRHSTNMTPAARLATSPALEASPKAQALPPLPQSRPLEGGKSTNQDTQKCPEQRDLHADLHWEISAVNPRNWSIQRRRVHTVITCAATFICMLASTILTPAQAPALDREMSKHAAVLPTSFYLLGLVFGPVIGDMGSQALGRKYTYVISLTLYMPFLLGAGLSRNLAGLVVCRFFAGLFCSPVLGLGIGTVLDIWVGHRRVYTLGLYFSTMLAGSNLGPVLGGYIAAKAGVSWTQYVILLAVVFLMMPIIWTQETAKKAIDRRKEGLSRLARITNCDWQIVSLAHFSTPGTDPIVWVMSLYTAYNIGVLYAIYVALPAVLAGVLAFSMGEQGLVFLSMIVGTVLASVFLFIFQRWCYEPRVERFREEKATDDERTLHTGRRATKGLSMKPSRESVRSSTHVPGSKRSSFIRSLKGLSSSGSKSGPQPQDDYQRNIIMAQAAALYLNGVQGNVGKPVTTDRILCILDQRLEFGEFCTVLEGLRLKYDRIDLAKVLVEALATKASPSTNISIYTWNNNSSVNDIEQHRKATAEALEAVPIPATPPPISMATTALSQRRKTFIPSANAPPPEWRLWLAIPASLLMVGSLFMLGWTINPHIHWMAPVTAMALFAFGLLVALVSTVQYLMECYDANELPVLAAQSTLYLFSAFVLSLFAQDVLHLGAGPGMSTYACFSMVFGSVPIILYFNGPKLRQRQSARKQHVTHR